MSVDVPGTAAPVLPAIGPREETVPVGVVLRRQPGVTRWAKWSWRPVAVLPGAGPAAPRPEAWTVLREEPSGLAEYHAATVPLTLHRAETEPYRVALSNDPPSLFVILRPNEDDASGAWPYTVFAVTASPYEAQDYADSAEEIVEPIAMPPAIIAWVSAFVEKHHVDAVFKKRRRDRVRVEAVEDGKGDARIAQAADVYRSPGSRRAARQAKPGSGGEDDGGGTLH